MTHTEQQIHYFVYKNDIRDFYVFSRDNKLIYASFVREVPRDLLKKATLNIHEPALVLAKRWLDIYFSGISPDFLPPLYFDGTVFQNCVWSLLLPLEFGKLETYGALGKRVAKCLNKPRMSAQAVGGAVGANPLSLFIPCHRIIGQNNKLTGYGGGLDVKIELLALEGHKVKEFK